jgi:hypothetical protein
MAVTFVQKVAAFQKRNLLLHCHPTPFVVCVGNVMRLFSFRCPSCVPVALKKCTNLLKAVKVAEIYMGKFQVWQGGRETAENTFCLNRVMSSVPNMVLVREAILAMSSKEGSKGGCVPQIDASFPKLAFAAPLFVRMRVSSDAALSSPGGPGRLLL